jgi:tetratricopeptide (TPR) repeat protein
LEEALRVLEGATARRPKVILFDMEAGKLLRSHGRLEEAARAFEKAAATVPLLPLPWEWLAPTRLELGQFAEARKATALRLKLLAKSANRRPLQRQLDLCDELLAVAADLPAILAGKERPAQASTLRALAEWCLKYKRLPATAAGFYEAAFAAQPALAEDLEAADRFDAACAAAQAGGGAGADAGQLGGDRRAHLRRQALAWLTADFDAWAERHRTGKSSERTAAAAAVRSWQRHDHLAGVRDEPALARLPDGERRAWQALWTRVAALAARDPVAQLGQARAYLARREWAKAVPCYAAVVELEPTDDADIWFEYAAAQLLAGDRPGHRRTCADLLARSETAPKLRPYLVARACTLAPDSTEDPKQLFRRFFNDLVFQKTEQHWALTEAGALYVRVGRPREAMLVLERSLVADGRPSPAVLNWLWLALAHQKRGKLEEARRWLDRATNWLDQQGGRMPADTPALGLHLHNWLEAHALRLEVEAQLR